MGILSFEATSPWQITRDDEHDAYELRDVAERVVATIPIGLTKTEITQHRAVRDLIAASPVLLAAAKLVLAELDSENPNLDACRATLGRAVAAARGEA